MGLRRSWNNSQVKKDPLLKSLKGTFIFWKMQSLDDNSKALITFIYKIFFRENPLKIKYHMYRLFIMVWTLDGSKLQIKNLKKFWNKILVSESIWPLVCKISPLTVI